MYYLMSQLPSLDGITEDKDMPITDDRFLELCSRYVSGKTMQNLRNLSLIPPRQGEKSSSDLIEAWNEGERDLRLALGMVRAEKMKKSFDTGGRVLSAEIMKTANTAADMDNPLKAEKFLNLYRMDFLETLRPVDTFSENYIYYYGLKLKLNLYIRQFDADIGKTAYKNIYNSILNENSEEAI